MTLDRRIWAVLIGGAALAAVMVAPKIVPGSTPARNAVTPAQGAPVLSRATSPEALVHVAGAVKRPGVYRVRGAARVRDAIARAGGARPGADMDAINLAARVADGQQVVVPARAAGTGGAAGAKQVSLGSATVDELDTLEGVGPVMAEKIVEWRTRKGGVGSVDELDQIPGIGPKKLETLREQLAP